MFNYKWFLKDIEKYKKPNNSLRVFGTFLCGGGSSMGYKLAGFNHIGGVELDPKIAKIYKKNHDPKYLFNEDIRTFLLKNDIPKELYDLDILDGSPPCSTFSMAGKREASWGKDKVFREGQSKQRLDDLFFTFIALAKKLQPKVIIAENVKGILQGNAKVYIKRILRELNEIGYFTQIFLLNSASMGVPQRRERVFFISHRKDLIFEKLNLSFNNPPIPFKVFEEKQAIKGEKSVSPSLAPLLKKCKYGESCGKYHPKGNYFTSIKCHPNKPLNTIASGSNLFHYEKIRTLTSNEILLGSSFPLDYQFLPSSAQYLCGMSVPPVMMAQISYQVALQWLGANYSNL